jgi:hypothetical protein
MRPAHIFCLFTISEKKLKNIFFSLPPCVCVTRDTQGGAIISYHLKERPLKEKENEHLQLRKLNVISFSFLRLMIAQEVFPPQEKGGGVTLAAGDTRDTLVCDGGTDDNKKNQIFDG